MKGRKGGQQVKKVVKLWLVLSPLLPSTAGWRGAEQGQRNEENIKHGVKKRGRLSKSARKGESSVKILIYITLPSLFLLTYSTYPSFSLSGLKLFLMMLQ